MSLPKSTAPQPLGGGARSDALRLREKLTNDPPDQARAPDKPRLEGVAVGESAMASQGPRRTPASFHLPARLRSGAAWVVGSRSLGIGVAMLLQILLTHTLSPDDFGAFTLISSIVAFGSLLVMGGFNAAAVRYVPESIALGRPAVARRFLRWAFVWMVACGLALGAATVLIWPWLAEGLALPAARWIAVMVAASIAALSLVQVIAESLRGFHELRSASLLSGGQTGGLASNIVFVLVAGASIAWTTPSLGSTLSAFLLSLLIVAPFALFALARAARASGGDAGREPALRDLASTCGVLMLIQCITFLSTQADIWIAGLCCPHDQLALYGAARRLVLIIVMPLQMANYLVVGSIAELLAQGRRAELERLLRSVATLFAAPAVLGLIVVVAAGGPLLSLLFGDFYRAAARPLILLSAGQLVLVAAGSCHSTLLMAGQQSKALCVNGLAAASIVLGGWLAAERYGVTGLAVAYSLVVALESLALLALARRSVGVWTHVNPRVDWASLRAAGGADLGVAGPAQDDADALGNAQEREHE